MKVSVVSDLHLEFHDMELPGGDILIMAGDCFVACQLDKMRRFAVDELAKYKKVFYVMGNHDHYRGIYENTPILLREFFAEYAKNTVLLDDSSEIYEGVAFIGSTLWAKYGHGKYAALEIGRSMNDLHLIQTNLAFRQGRKKIAPANTRKLTVPDVAAAHARAQKYLAKALRFTKENSIPTVVITHHAPSYLSKGKRFKYCEDGVDEAYYSNQHKLIEDNPQIKVCIHGHTHDTCRYMIGNTRIISNQRGYYPHERCSLGFDPQLEDFDLEEIKEQVMETGPEAPNPELGAENGTPADSSIPGAEKRGRKDR